MGHAHVAVKLYLPSQFVLFLSCFSISSSHLSIHFHFACSFHIAFLLFLVLFALAILAFSFLHFLPFLFLLSLVPTLLNFQQLASLRWIQHDPSSTLSWAFPTQLEHGLARWSLLVRGAVLVWILLNSQIGKVG